LRAIGEQVLDQFPAPDSTTDLHFDIGRAEYGLNLWRVIASTSDAVEIHDVKVPKPVLSPGSSYSQRIRNSNQLFIVQAPGELDASSTSKVKRGNCDHPARPRIKAWIMTGEGATLFASWRACE
jgi:hypothetical protein